MESGTQFLNTKVRITHLLLDIRQYLPQELLVGGSRLYRRRSRLYLALIRLSHRRVMLHDIPYFRQQHFKVKRLADKIGGARLQPLQLDRLTRHRRKQDHRGLTSALVAEDLLAQLDAIHMRHADIAHHQCRMRLKDFLPAFFPVRRLHDLIVRPQVLFEIEPEVFIVLDEQDRRRIHRRRRGYPTGLGRSKSRYHRFITMNRNLVRKTAIRRKTRRNTAILRKRKPNHLERQLHCKTAPPVHLAFDLQPPLMHPHKFLRDAKPDTTALVDHRLGDLILKEPLEDLLLLVGRDADAGVTDRDRKQHVTVANHSGYPHRHRAILWRELEGIGKQVEKDTLQLVLVEPRDQRPVVLGIIKPDILLIRQIGKRK